MTEVYSLRLTDSRGDAGDHPKKLEKTPWSEYDIEPCSDLNEVVYEGKVVCSIAPGTPRNELNKKFLEWRTNLERKQKLEAL